MSYTIDILRGRQAGYYSCDACGLPILDLPVVDDAGENIRHMHLTCPDAAVADPAPGRAPGGCPHCDTALAPEPIAPGTWLCPCCASLFQAPTP